MKKQSRVEIPTNSYNPRCVSHGPTSLSTLTSGVSYPARHLHVRFLVFVCVLVCACSMCMRANGRRMELTWSRLELGLLFGGFVAGGMRTADALEELVDVRFSFFLCEGRNHYVPGMIFDALPCILYSFTITMLKGIMHYTFAIMQNALV